MCYLHWSPRPFVWLSTINVTDGLKQAWNPDLLCQASEAWQLLWEVVVSTCLPAVCVLVPELIGDGRRVGSSLRSRGGGILARIFKPKTRFRETDMWASKPSTTVVFKSVLFIVYGNRDRYMDFFPYFCKAKKSKVLKNGKNVQWSLLIFTTNIQWFECNVLTSVYLFMLYPNWCFSTRGSFIPHPLGDIGSVWRHFRLLNSGGATGI